MSGWLLLHAYVLVDFLDSVASLFQSGVSECVLFYGGLLPFYVCVEILGACYVYLQNVFVYAEETVSQG